MPANVYFSLLPSEVCRLVLGYLKDIGCLRACDALFQECTYLEELRNECQTAHNVTYSVGGFTLTEILKDYFNIATMVNEQRESMMKTWTSSSLPICRLGDISPLLKRLFADSCSTVITPPKASDRITSPLTIPNVKSLTSLSLNSSRRITILRTNASSASTQNRIKVIPSISTAPTIPKVLKVVRIQPVAISAKPSCPSSSRRKPHSKPMHVTESSTSSFASENTSQEAIGQEEINIQSVFCKLAANAETVADRINSNLSGVTTDEPCFSQFELPLPPEIDQNSSNLSEQDMQDFINQLLNEVDNLGSKSPEKTADITTNNAPSPPVSTISSMVAAKKVGGTRRGRVPVKSISSPHFESSPDESLTEFCSPTAMVTSSVSIVTSTISTSLSPFPTAATISSTCASLPKRSRLSSLSFTSAWAESQSIPCEEYPFLSPSISRGDDSAKGIDCELMESSSVPNSIYAMTSELDDLTWQYTCKLPPPALVVDLDNGPFNGAQTVPTSLLMPDEAPSAPPTALETAASETDWFLPSLLPVNELNTSMLVDGSSSASAPQSFDEYNIPLPVVDLTKSIVELIPLGMASSHSADSSLTPSNRAPTRLSNSRLLDFINTKMGGINQRHQHSPSPSRVSRRRKTTQPSLLPWLPPPTPQLSCVSLSPSAAKENVSPGPPGTVICNSGTAPATSSKESRSSNAKKFDLANLDVTATLAKVH